MRIQFGFTPEELLDSTQRCASRSKVNRSSRWKGIAALCLVTSVVCYACTTGGESRKWTMASIAAVVGAVIFPVLDKRGRRGNLRKLIDEQLASAPGEPLICEVELTSNGISVRQTGMTILYDWRKIEEPQETPDSIDVFSTTGGGVIVRKRAFQSKEEQAQFLEAVRDGARRAKAVASNRMRDSSLIDREQAASRAD